MKKTQKKLGNKGFSLVELIVVIAIMAVLVGVLAPTLIRNVEKSRESTDIQNLDTIRTSVVTAMSNEAVARAADGGKNIKLSQIKAAGDTDTTSLAALLKEELTQDDTVNVTMKSSNASGNEIYINISATGAVTVYVGKSDNSEIIKCKRTTSTKSNAKREYSTDEDFKIADKAATYTAS
jgi:type IV pilus assembly protein PilA